MKLVAVALVGWWLVALARVTGYAIYYGGVLALLVKLVFEAVVRAESR